MRKVLFITSTYSMWRTSSLMVVASFCWAQ